jgi:hypothetical protein
MLGLQVLPSELPRVRQTQLPPQRRPFDLPPWSPPIWSGLSILQVQRSSHLLGSQKLITGHRRFATLASVEPSSVANRIAWCFDSPECNAVAI